LVFFVVALCFRLAPQALSRRQYQVAIIFIVMQKLFILKSRKRFLNIGNNCPKILAVCLAFLCCMVSPAHAQAPNISYSSPQVYNPFIPISPLYPTNTGGAVPGLTPAQIGQLAVNISGIALDTSRNVYIIGSSSTVVTKLVGNTYISLGSGFLHPGGIAVDAAGNVYISDGGHNKVKEILAGSNTVVTLANVSSPGGVAVDAAGNIYVSTGTSIDKIPAGGGSPITYASGFSAPRTIASDAAGNIYVSDFGTSDQIKEVLASDKSVIALTNQVPQASGLAVDTHGNIYFTENFSSVYEVLAGGRQPFAVVTGLSEGTAVAVDKSGNIYTAGSARIYRAPYGIYTCSPALPAGINIDHKTGYISGAPLVLSPATNYNITASNSSGSSTTTINITVSAASKPYISYSTPQSYNAGTPVSIAPVNTGGVVPTQNPVTLESGLPANVSGLAVDASGNVYAANISGTSIVKYGPGGNTWVNIGSGFTNTTGVAVDASGNVFVVDNGNKVIKKILASNGSIVTYSSGYIYPLGIAIDAAGNLYVSDPSKNAILKVPAGGGVGSVMVSGLNSPAGVAVDPAGNVYFANKGENTVREIPAGTSSTIIVASGLNGPYGVAVDPGGNVFVADGVNKAVKRIPAGGGAPVAIAKSILFKQPCAVALDANGNIYVSDWANKAIYEINPGYYINPTLPAGLSIDQSTGTISGTPTTVTPKTNYTVSARNSGGVSVATVEITINPYQPPSVSYTGPQVYATNLAITPLVPKSSNAFPPTYQRTVTSFASGLTGNVGIAIDNAGNVYVAETGNTHIVKIASDGVTMTNLGSGFSSPMGVAVDNSGNVYVADYGNHAVKEITTGGTILTLGSGFTNPISVAVDALGNVYVADYTYGIKKIPAGSSTPVIIAPAGYSSAQDIAVDGYGNVFFGGVYEILASDGSIKQYYNSLSLSAFSVVVDAAGNIYYSADLGDRGPRAIFEFGAGIYPGQQLYFGSTQNSTDKVYLAVDGKGVLYMSDPTTGTITKAIPQGGYFIDKFLPAGLGFDAITGIISGTPNATSPATDYTVTAYNTGGSSSGIVNIKTVGAGNTSLTNLAVGNGTLSPSFATATTSYSVTEPYTTTSITVTPTAAGGTASILVNGVSVTSGTASAAIPLSVGANTIGITVTDNGGTTVSNYTITANRTGNASLANLAISAGTLSPTFASGTYSYSAILPAGVSIITVTPTLTDATGTITVNGKGVATGTASTNIQLAIGSNPVTIITTAADGVTTQTYTLNAIRPSANANLSAISFSKGSVSPAFNANTLSYTVAIANTVTSVTVKPTTADVNATVTINGAAVTSGTSSAPISLSVGANTITVAVTAQDATTTKTYTFTVNRPPSNNDNLSSIGLSAGALTPAFASATTAYTASVVNGVASIKVTPTATDPDATIKVNGITVASGTASGAIALTVGANTISIAVTASNGTSTKTYTLTVTRAASNNANLAGFFISKGTLTPAFAPGTTSYTASVPNSVTAITIVPTAANDAATIKVNGTVVNSGTVSGSIALAVGPNAITTVVTAQDGTTTKTYTLTITRAAGPINIPDESLSINQPVVSPPIEGDGVIVHQGISPNGDGINDYLTIENITNYPDNKLAIINRNGQLIFETQGYDNSTKVFDGHSNKTGQLQLPGTYFYQLDYTVNGIIKHKTGFLVLKY